VEFGVHLPLIDLGEGVLGSAELRAFARTAAESGYTVLSSNDHLVWQRPWLDGPSVLTSVAEASGAMTLATSVALPTVRHPVVLAKWLTTLACLTDRRIIAGLGPGSSRADYRAVGVPFDERWSRFDEAFAVVMALVRGDSAPDGRFYEAAEVRLEPLPERAPEVWFGSWGSDKRLAAMAEVADGWMASAYNTSPARFAEARARLDGHLDGCGRDPGAFPDMIATSWSYVTDDRQAADRLLHELLGPVLGRDPGELATQLPIGPPEHCARLLQAYADAGARRILLWPVRDPIGQLGEFMERVAPQLGA
jgi:alkanesulfonate monooxygenase SsuD/methylene tetrahydromethanopterin reductase-like flavin-dependent oxidoreductase (luciferase family)